MRFAIRSPLFAGVAVMALTATAKNFPLGTYVYRGSVLNYKHEVCTSASGLTVQAVATNGVVLASCRVTDPVATSGVNYVLEVPVATEASSKSAAIGDKLRCVVRSDGGQTSISTQDMPELAAANAITNMNVIGVSATAFTKDGDTVLVADDYIAGLAPWMRRYGKSSYDPFADWDGDGISNYNEYKDGTNPFDPSDRLRITAFAARHDAPTLLSFEYVGGHLYALDASTSLTNKAWMAESFRVDPDQTSQQRTVTVEGNEYENVGEMTLYLAPAAESPSMFYMIHAE